MYFYFIPEHVAGTRMRVFKSQYAQLVCVLFRQSAFVFDTTYDILTSEV